MNLKEAASYGAFLNDMILKSQTLAGDATYFKKVTETHNRKKANPDAQDEVLVVEPQNKLNINSDGLIFFCKKLIEEKLALDMAIEKSKSKLFIDWKENDKKLSLDNAVSYNKQLRNLIYKCDSLKNAKSTEMKKNQYDYKFNVEGNQTSYQYEVITRYEVNFDKNAVMDLNRSLKEKADKISNLIDQAQNKDVIEFNPNYSRYDSFEELIENYNK